jgi:hypothetical protein
MLVPVRGMGKNVQNLIRMKADRFLRFLYVMASTFTFVGVAPIYAGAPNGGRITYVSNDVRLAPKQGAAPRVSIGEVVSPGTTINSGTKARSELTFENQTVARLGANTSLKLGSELATMELRDGAMLFQIPKGASAEITAGPIIITSKRATGLLERNRDTYIKLLLLEGEARVALSNRVGESMVVEPGQVLITGPKAASLPEAAYFDIVRAVRTCQLISEFPPLRNQDSIEVEARKQIRLTNKGTYVPSNLVIFGRGTLVSLVPPKPSDNVGQKKTPDSQPAN